MDHVPKQSTTRNSNDKETTMDSNDETILLPGLPNHLAQVCLSALRPSLLYSVCRSWRRLIYSPSFPPFSALYAVVASPKQKKLSDSIGFLSYDPISSTWTSLPSPAMDPPLHVLHRHPSFISRTLSIQSLTVSGYLILIAATTPNFLPALSRPLVFEPSTNKWFFGPSLSNPRRWCIAGSINGMVYIASGVGSRYSADVARLVERWDLEKKRDEWKWEKMEGLKDGRFSREAVEAVGYKGKLCIVNVKGNAVKDGAVYDVREDRWEKMAEGMLLGWNGPVAVEDNEVMYVVDEEKGDLSRYDDEKDCWEKMIEGSEHFRGAEQIAVGGGKICIVCASGGRIVVVDVAAKPVRLWVVNAPADTEVISAHILRRMSCCENYTAE